MTGKATVDKLQDRSRHSLLDALDPDEWAELAAFARREIYEADEVIFRKGDPGHSMMTVVRGRIKISSSSSEGKEVVLALLGQGEVLGEMAVLEGKPRSTQKTEALLRAYGRFVESLDGRYITAEDVGSSSVTGLEAPLGRRLDPMRGVVVVDAADVEGGVAEDVLDPQGDARRWQPHHVELDGRAPHTR